jgi:diguanylate cyclase (GGDEF)-like protein
MADGELGRRPAIQVWHVLAAMTTAALAVMAAAALALRAAPPTAAAWSVAVGALCIAAGRIPASSIRTGHHTGDYDLSDAAVVIALVLLPAPELILVTAVAVTAAHALMRKSFVKVLFNGASVTVGVALAAAVVLAAGGAPGALPGAKLLLTIPAGLAVCMWTTLSVTVVLAAASGRPLRRTLREAAGRSTAIAVGNVALGCAVVALARWSPPTLIVLPPVLVGLVAVYRLHVASTRQRDSWRLLNAAARELADLDEDAVTTRAHALAQQIFRPDGVEIMIGVAGPAAAVGAAAPTAAGGRVRDVDHPVVGPAGQIGVVRLEFTEPAPWTDHEHDVLAAFANLLALAVENARSYTEARHAASHDALTELGNRRMLSAHGARILARDADAGTAVALLLVDLDRFKDVNDTLGHSAGDRLLRGVAERLRRSVRSDDLVARFGGDEFAVLLRGLADADAADAVADALVKALARPITVDGVSLAVEASIGLACFPADGDSVEELLRRADVALHQAKQARCGHRRYRSADDPSTLDDLALVADLHPALADGDVGLRCSPQLDLATGTITAVEALPHWVHARLGPLPRRRFLAAAGRSALAGALTRRILDLALRACADWRAQGHRVRVCVRLFPRNLLEPDLARDVARLLLRHRVPADALTLAVPAGALAGEAAASTQAAALRRLGLGLRLCGEDLWSAAEPLDWLAEPAGGVDEVELGPRAVAGLAGPGPAAPLARAVVGLAHELGTRVVARGVDTPAALAALVDLGFDGVHGRLAERPGAAVGPDPDTGVETPQAAPAAPSREPDWDRERGVDPAEVPALLCRPAMPVAEPARVLAFAGARRPRRR